MLVRFRDFEVDVERRMPDLFSTLRVGALLACAAALACTVSPAATTPRSAAPDERFARPSITSVGRIDAPEINESSGLVASRRHAGIFWTHNDSGDVPRIFAIDPGGAKVAEYAVEGALAVDWEDIAIDGNGRLYLGDIGNNGNDRRDLAVYVIPEPDPARSGAVRVERVLRYRYADQTGFPDPSHLEFDCEAMLHWDGALYLFSKHRGNTRTRLYRLEVEDGPAGDAEVALAPIATIELGAPSPFGVPTAADISADGRYVALLTYVALFIYERSGDDLVPRGPIARIELDAPQTRQVESVAWDGSALVFGNEQRALFRIESPLSPSLWRYPGPSTPR